MLRPIVICMFRDASPSIWIHTHEALTLGKAEWQRRIVSLDRVVRESFATLTVTETKADHIRHIAGWLA
jgi:hypothetical protein